MQFEKIVCPICKNAHGQNIYEKKHAVLFGNELRHCLLAQVICPGCGLIYTNPQPTSKSLNEFYDQYFMYGESADDPIRRRQINFLLAHSGQKEKTLFDIGAHNGTFMDLAARAGFTVAGIEPSSRAREEAKSRFGYELIPGFFKNEIMSEIDGPYDVVVLNHVLEHVKDPLEVLRLAGAVTNQGGYVFVEVPDMENPQTDNMADFFTPEHTVYFTSGTLAFAAQKAGLVLEHLERDEQKHAFRVLLRKATEAPGSSQKRSDEYSRGRDIMADFSARKIQFQEGLAKALERITGDVVIYGAGMHSAQLLRSGVLRGLTVVAVVDSNSDRWGSVFDEFEVQSPQILARGNFTVVISSFESQEQIADYLDQEFPDVRQIKLYSR